MASEKARAKKPGQLLKPGMLMLAASFMWSAQHEPQSFTAGSLGGWVLGAVTAALLARAALALITPLLRIIGIIFGHALKALQTGAEP